MKKLAFVLFICLLFPANDYLNKNEEVDEWLYNKIKKEGEQYFKDKGIAVPVTYHYEGQDWVVYSDTTHPAGLIIDFGSYKIKVKKRADGKLRCVILKKIHWEENND